MKMKRTLICFLTAFILFGHTEADDSPLLPPIAADLSHLAIALGNRTAFSSQVTADEGYFIYDFAYCQGEEFQYCVYEFRCPGNLPDIIEWGGPPVYWEIVVLQECEPLTILREFCNDSVSSFPGLNLVCEGDANFDGQTDILLCKGSFGIQGGQFFACYLQHNGTFIHCPSFSDIPNPILDSDNRVILGTWRNSSASHRYFLSYYVDGAFQILERLANGPKAFGSDEFGWLEEKFIDGAWQETQWIEVGWQDSAPIPEQFVQKDSHWCLSSGRWSDHRGIRYSCFVGGSILYPYC